MPLQGHEDWKNLLLDALEMSDAVNESRKYKPQHRRLERRGARLGDRPERTPDHLHQVKLVYEDKRLLAGALLSGLGLLGSERLATRRAGHRVLQIRQDVRRRDRRRIALFGIESPLGNSAVFRCLHRTPAWL